MIEQPGLILREVGASRNQVLPPDIANFFCSLDLEIFYIFVILGISIKVLEIWRSNINSF